MKKLFIFFHFSLLFCCSAIKAQTVKLGITSETKTGELRTTDRLNGKHHYTGFQFTLKKGAGAVFFMQSKTFSPYVALLSPGNGKYFGLLYINNQENNLKESRVSFIAPADTSFYIIFSSVEENTTGAFNFGYYLLDSSQMSFSENYSICNRLVYLFNHWQVNWELMLAKEYNGKADFNNYGPTVSLKNKSAKSVMGKGFAATFPDNIYEEKMYSSPLKLFTKENFYDPRCAEIKACLDTNQWEVQTETVTTSEPNAKGGRIVTNDITHFIPKGSAKDQKMKSFKIVFKFFLGETGFMQEVVLVFN